MSGRFNPRSLAGSDMPRCSPAACFEEVSIHAPLRGATQLSASSPAANPCFNPRSLAGSDAVYIRLQNRRHVSIHAPLRGATSAFRGRGMGEAVSIHAPLRGATPGGVAGLAGRRVSIHAPLRGATSSTHHFTRSALFQSTLPCGERRQPAIAAAHRCEVSIHAPLRGATATAKVRTMMDLFQSTLPCGERRK